MSQPRVLLDVNVLIALAWPNHVHHVPARRWFANQSAQGWATTPLTETGFVRVSSNKAVVPAAATPAASLQVLTGLCEQGDHEFWPDSARLLDEPYDLARLATARQVTDAHLLAVALGRGGRLATFDRGVPELLPTTLRDHVELLTAN